MSVELQSKHLGIRITLTSQMRLPPSNSRDPRTRHRSLPPNAAFRQLHQLAAPSIDQIGAAKKLSPRSIAAPETYAGYCVLKYERHISYHRLHQAYWYDNEVRNWILKGAVACGSLVYGIAFGQSGSFLVASVYQYAQYPCGSADTPLQGLLNPNGFALDSVGSIYIYEIQRGLICKIKPDGKPEVLTSGVGVIGARIVSKNPLAVDKQGNIYFVRFSDLQPPVRNAPIIPSSIYRLSAAGNVTRLLDSEAFALAADSSGSLYYSVGSMVNRVGSNGITTRIAGTPGGSTGDGGAATAAALTRVEDLSFDDSGNLFLADLGASRVRKISPSGTISTVLNVPASLISVDHVGNVYAMVSKTVQKLSPAGAVEVVAGGGVAGGLGGPAKDLVLGPVGFLAVDQANNPYLNNGSSVLKLIPSSSTEGCRYGAQVSQSYFHQAGGDATVSVAVSHPGCPWLLNNLADWVSVSNHGVISGDGVVNVSVNPNASPKGRVAGIGVAGQSITITQDGATCVFTLRTTDVGWAAQGGQSTVSFTGNLPDCPWAAKTSAAWVTLSGSVSGVGSGSVSYTVQPNPGIARTGEIKIGDQVFVISQTPVGFDLPTISGSSIVNAASAIPGPLVPGELVTLYGAGLGPQLGMTGFKKGLGNTSVFVNGVESYIAYTSMGQVNAMIPFEGSSVQTSNIQVKYQSVPGNMISLPTSNSFPGIFTVDSSGRGQAVITNSDGTLNSASAPALPGSIITFFLTGYGQTDPPSLDGVPPSPPTFPVPVSPLAIRIGGILIGDKDVLFAGAVYVGILQVNVRLPSALPQTDAVDVSVSVGGVSSRSGVTIALQQVAPAVSDPQSSLR